MKGVTPTNQLTANKLQLATYRHRLLHRELLLLLLMRYTDLIVLHSEPNTRTLQRFFLPNTKSKTRNNDLQSMVFLYCLVFKPHFFCMYTGHTDL